MGFRRWLGRKVTDWLTYERTGPDTPLCDFDKIRFEVRLGDVLLVEGRSRVSEVIKLVTQSPWTHSALYIGRLVNIEDPQVRLKVRQRYHGDPAEPLVIEALMGQGIVVTPLSDYRGEHLRICRPRGLAPDDAQRVVAHVAERLGQPYDTRQILDLARFLFPWGILPRRWRSSLFQHNAGEPTRTVCSTLLVDAFNAVDFPVLPVVRVRETGEVRLYTRNSRLYSPRDFDYSPYFDIIKYPFIAFEDAAMYRRLPWERGMVCNSEEDLATVGRDAGEGNHPLPSN